MNFNSYSLTGISPTLKPTLVAKGTEGGGFVTMWGSNNTIIGTESFLESKSSKDAISLLPVQPLNLYLEEGQEIYASAGTSAGAIGNIQVIQHNHGAFPTGASPVNLTGTINLSQH